MNTPLLRHILFNHNHLHLHSTRTFCNSTRKFNVIGLQQIAIGAPDKSVLRSLWQDIFGINKIGSYRSENENVDEDILSLGKGLTSVEIDLMQPIDKDKSPRVDTPALNHIGLWVDDLKTAYTELEASGVRFTPGVC